VPYVSPDSFGASPFSSAVVAKLGLNPFETFLSKVLLYEVYAVCFASFIVSSYSFFDFVALFHKFKNVIGCLLTLLEKNDKIYGRISGKKKKSVEKKREEIPDEFIKYLCLRNLNNVRRFF
jgi:hypothetical protein